MPRCGFADCDRYNHGGKGFFNPTHVPEFVIRDTKDGRTYYCCMEHAEWGA